MPIASSSTVSTQNRIEAPFIIVEIGGVKFGHCSDMSNRTKLGSIVTYPNFMKSIHIVKINGAVNTYTIQMEYGITENDDPNLIEKILSSVNKTREIKISYGDWNSPSYVFRDEVALITKVTNNIDFNNSRINYTIKAVSSSMKLTAGNYSFPARVAKPSDVIKELISNEAYGLTEVFGGMSNMTKNALENLIAGDDKAVQLRAKSSTSVLDYISYLVNCMESVNNSNSVIKDANYTWGVFDDVNNERGGSYFKVVKVEAETPSNISYSTYEVDVGYPSGSYVTAFDIKTDNAWSILYDYGGEIAPQQTYTINRDGEIEALNSPSVTNSKTILATTQTDKTWWTQMTQFPITATLTVKGLLRSTMLMTYVKVNAYFYGKKHVASGLYIITKHEDLIDGNGYKTTLSLTRVGGDTSPT